MKIDTSLMDEFFETTHYPPGAGEDWKKNPSSSDPPTDWEEDEVDGIPGTIGNIQAPVNPK